MRDVSRNTADILELYEMKVGKHIGKCFRVGVLGNTRYRDSGSHYLAVLIEAKNGAVPLGRFNSFCPHSLYTTANIWRNYTMTKIELLRQYIGDLKMHVPESPGRDNRIAVLEEELENEQLQNTPSNSEYEKSCECGSRAVIMVCEKCNKSTEIMDYPDFA
jgi:hypothetical protein